MSNLKKQLDEVFKEGRRFTPDLEQKVLDQIRKKRKKPEWIYYFAFTAAAAVGIFFAAVSLQPDGLEDPGRLTGKPPIQKTEDSGTTEVQEEIEQVPFILLKSKSQDTVKYEGESMDMGSREYTEFPLIINQGVRSFKRGEVVYYQPPGGVGDLTRVVGLPGETIEIKKGIVYINGVKLEERYGKVHRAGIGSLEEMIKGLKENGASQNIESMKELFNTSMEPVNIPDGHIFAIGDDWFRGKSELVATEEIKGRVAGYEFPAAELGVSEKDLLLYKQFAAKMDLELLRNQDQVQIVKLYLLASIANHFKVQYSLYTDRPEWIQWSLNEHLAMQKEEADSYEPYFNKLRALEGATFKQTDEISGYVQSWHPDSGAAMIRNEDGIWQLSFMPFQ